MPELAEVRFKENYKVTVHRRFAEAIFDTPLSIYEQRILYAALSNIEPPIYQKDENNKLVLNENGEKIITNYLSEFPIFEMRLKEFGELIGLKEIDYRHIKKIMRDFKKKGLEIHRLDRPEHEINEKDYRGINFLLESEYLHNAGIVRLEFSPKLLPYVANLTGEFITVPLSVITSFTSKYSTKLYFLLQQWKMFKHKEIEINELKALMGVPFEVKYESGKPTKVFKLDLYANFKNRALIPALNEINKFSNLNIGFVEIKKGKRVGKIKFTIGQDRLVVEQKPNNKKPKNSYSIYQYLAKEVFGNFGFGTLFFKNVAKSLEGISNLDSDRDLEFKVYLGLTDLKVYFENQGTLKEGWLINNIRQMVESYNEQGIFEYKNEYVRTEMTPEWLIENRNEETKNKRLEFEREQPFTVIRKENLPEPDEKPSEASKAPSEDNKAKLEEEKQAVLLQIEKNKLKAKYSKDE